MTHDSQAYKRGMWYPQYHFMLNGWYSDGWWRAENKFSNSTPNEIEQVIYYLAEVNDLYSFMQVLQHTLTVEKQPDARILGDSLQVT